MYLVLRVNLIIKRDVKNIFYVRCGREINGNNTTTTRKHTSVNITHGSFGSKQCSHQKSGRTNQ